MSLTGRNDPRVILARASRWLAIIGGMFVAWGIGALLHSAMESPGDPAMRVWNVLREIGAVAGWVAPGLLMLMFSIFLRRRRRWAITGAEIVVYVQMFFAGALMVVSLLHVRTLWPNLLIAMAWLVPLILTPRFTAPCPRAMDLMAQLPTLGVESAPRARRMNSEE